MNSLQLEGGIGPYRLVNDLLDLKSFDHLGLVNRMARAKWSSLLPMRTQLGVPLTTDASLNKKKLKRLLNSKISRLQQLYIGPSRGILNSGTVVITLAPFLQRVPVASLTLLISITKKWFSPSPEKAWNCLLTSINTNVIEHLELPVAILDHPSFSKHFLRSCANALDWLEFVSRNVNKTTL